MTVQNVPPLLLSQSLLLFLHLLQVSTYVGREGKAKSGRAKDQGKDSDLASDNYLFVGRAPIHACSTGRLSADFENYAVLLASRSAVVLFRESWRYRYTAGIGG